MAIEIRELRTRDYAKAAKIAIDGMHLHWYVDRGFALDCYARCFFSEELERATIALGAYDGDRFLGVLLAGMEGEERCRPSWARRLFVRACHVAVKLLSGGSVDPYDEANASMLEDLKRSERPDGELLFLAADPEAHVPGVGTALLAELERREPGKLVYLYTDSACTWQFYEHRGFVRCGERSIVDGVGPKRVPLDCFLYTKRLG